MSAVTVVRWRRFGKDRLYVNGPDERRLGWCDLLTGAVTVEDHADRETVEAALESWRTLAEVPVAATATSPPPRAAEAGVRHETPSVPTPAAAVFGEPSLPTLERTRPVEPEWEDLAGRRAGQAAREQALALKEAAPVRTFLARVLRVHTDERAWRIGADGEEKVAAQVAKLTAKDPRWRVLHAVPVGENGSDIDHVVIGPPGVFTLNAKHHPGAKIWVAGNTFMVNGQKQPYLRNSRHEAQRAAKLLTAAAGIPLHAVGVVVPVGAQDVTIKTEPEGVHVVYRKALVKWLQRQPEQLDEATVERIYVAARRSTTWQTATAQR
ncbi:NERD domain-containing protein [Actinotalea ferrariae]|uniref:nuclease-related domain-containing protein n=1 Tax=Actinotalea ferrariae TaxID=1386098 RepID=UPI001C8B1174|nr:nuclease-related domain-containing protein [Actinotalea ferrariae]MBX9245827.1 NERD domain-containing protein [Actinotalea ferrariae]